MANDTPMSAIQAILWRIGAEFLPRIAIAVGPIFGLDELAERNFDGTFPQSGAKDSARNHADLWAMLLRRMTA